MINILSIDLDWIMEPCIEIYNLIVTDQWEESWNLIRNRCPGINLFPNYQKLYQLTELLFNKDAMVDPSHIYITESHAEIYDAIEQWNIDKPFSIFNVDHHHDCGYDNDFNVDNLIGDFFQNVKCSNWVPALRYQNNKFVKYYWINNYNSDNTIHNEVNGYVPNFNISSDIDILKPIKFDYIFICQSLGWIPPNLYPVINGFLHAFKQFYRLDS